MASDHCSHRGYLDAFEQFLQTGSHESLVTYLKGDRPAAFLSVYRNGFIRASVAALESNFPSLVKLWGDAYFAQVAGAYATMVPPTTATLIGYGFDHPLGETSLSFMRFLQHKTVDIIAQFPYVLDICRLDQAWLQALNEDGTQFLTLEIVQNLISRGEDLSMLPLTLVDSSCIVNLQYDIFDLWGQLRFGELTGDQRVELGMKDNAVIFWQKDLQVQAKPLSVVEAVFMQSLKQSASFDTATNEASALDERFDISTLFAELLTAHLLKQKNNA